MATSARLDELKKKFDENPRRYFAPLANEYRKLGDLIQAIALCRTHLPNQPGHISGNIVLAQALYESRELADSRQAFEAALDLDPENLIALRFLGDIAREEGAPAVAIGWYQRVLEADPRNDEIAQLMRDVQAEEAAARSELASRPTPQTVHAIVETPEEVAPAVELEESFSLDAPEELTIPSAEELSLPSAEEIAAPVEAEAPALAPVSDAVEEAMEPLELPSFDATFEAPAEPAPAFESHEEDPFFSQSALGEFEAVAEPSMDDWFASEPVAEAPAAIPEAESFFPDLSTASELPAPAEAEAAPEGVAEEFSWDAPSEPEPAAEIEEQAPVAQVEEPVAIDYSADPESDTIEFTIEAATPLPDPFEEQDAPSQVVSEAVEVAETFEPAPWAAAEAFVPAVEDTEIPAPVAEVSEVVEEFVADEPVAEAPSYDWSTGDVPAEPVAEWTEAATSEMPSAWESALAPEQLTPVSEVPMEREPNPLLGRTPRFDHAIPEEPPPAPFVTETMAELYLQQGFTEEGLAIYRQLLRQSPSDESLQRRVAALESGGESNVLDAASEAPSVRAFFARFATRARRASGDAPNDVRSSLGGVASADEAMTQPDEPSSLTQVFSSRAVSTADAQAAATLASAFGIESSSDTGSEGELSLGHLFRDVEAHSTGAVTSAEFADSTAGADTRQASDVESHADIEQFTAWLEGLKKK